MKHFLYIRGLRQVEHTVFAVNDGQKFYYDLQFSRRIPYASGQQVKRCLIQAMDMGESPVTFNWAINKKDNKAEQKEPHVTCDPTYVDQLLGGYMSLTDYPVKRRSPLSISAMRPLHPLLGGIERPHENLSFDRSNNPGRHNVRVYWGDKKEQTELTEEELDEWLTTNKRTLPSRSFIQDQTRVSGLFIYDVCIDLRRLFCVSTSRLEAEITPEMEQKLIREGWQRTETDFGPSLVCPENIREQIIDALAAAIIDWRITTNQARTFSIQPTIAIAVSGDANNLASVFRGELKEDYERQVARPVIDREANVDLFVSPLISGIIQGEKGDVNAMEIAKQHISRTMKGFDYENQL